jgi:hypothetical protein
MKKFGLLMMIALIAGFSACSVENMADIDGQANAKVAESSPVKLLYAKVKTVSAPYDGSAYPSYIGSVDGYIEVENLGYNKTIVCHYNEESSSTWYDVQAEYVGPSTGNKEIWHFETDGTTFVGRWEDVEFTFAIKYTVNGNVYWDNNDGSDYNVSYGIYSTFPSIVLGASALKLEMASFVPYAGAFYLHGLITLKDLAYNKDVKILFTQDNWNTSKEVSASYGGQHTGWGGMDVGYQDWVFNTTFPSIDNVQFAISYTANGVTYWDNNLGNDYELEYNSAYNM